VVAVVTGVWGPNGGSGTFGSKGRLRASSTTLIALATITTQNAGITTKKAAPAMIERRIGLLMTSGLATAALVTCCLASAGSIFDLVVGSITSLSGLLACTALTNATPLMACAPPMLAGMADRTDR